jgi:predicted transcriptional regulator
MDESHLPATETVHVAATPPDHLSQWQQAFLLGQVADAGEDGKPLGELNKGIRAEAKRQLRIDATSANKVRAELVARGYLAIRKKGRQVRYVLTEAGREYLVGLDKPLLNEEPRLPSVNEANITDEVREAQRAYLLLQLLDAEGRSLPKGEANKIPEALRTGLGLTPAAANYRRARLAEQGYLQIRKVNRSEEYELTTHGLDFLATCDSHLAHATFPIRGATLNTLLSAARDSSFGRDRRALPPDKLAVPQVQELADAVLAQFQELRREQHGRDGLVPIHEVRQKIAQRFGEGAARHDVLDEIILDLWRQGKLRLTAISDLREANEQELNDSIPGEGQTYFYLETAHGQPVVL